MIKVETFQNGLTLIVEEIGHFESASFEIQIPGGIVSDSPDRIGESILLAKILINRVKKL